MLVAQPTRRGAPNTVDQHLQRLGVTAHDVKVWAVAQGLVPAVRRGRIGTALVEAYAAAHTTSTPAGS